MARGFGGLPVTGVSLSANRGSIVEEAFGIATQPVIYGGTYSVSGSFDAVYRSDMNTILTSFFNGFTTGIATPTASISLADDVSTYTISEYAFNSLELKGAVKDFLRMSVGFIAQKATTASGSSGTSGTYTNSPAPFYNTLVEIDGTVKCTAFSIKFDRPIDTDNFVLGSEFLQQSSDSKYIQTGASAVSGSLTIANTEYDQFIDLMDTGSDTVAPASSNKNTLGGGTITITCGELSSNNTISVPVVFTEGSVSAQGRAKFDKTISFMCPIDAAADITCFGVSVT